MFALRSASAIFPRGGFARGFIAVLVAGSVTSADTTLYRYEAAVLPSDSSAGWRVYEECSGPCGESIETGHFVLRWPGGGNFVNYHLWIATTPEQNPPTMWIEWRFRSNDPFEEVFGVCDGRVAIGYRNVFEVFYLYGDALIDQSGGRVMRGLDIDEFHTYRFESTDGLRYGVFVDGSRFVVTLDNNSVPSFIQIGGSGGCDTTRPPTVVNEWDFVRYGTISYGEQIVASDPPAGVVNTLEHPGLDRFTVTFDEPNYVVISEIIVSVTGGPVPRVIKTRRREPPDPLQVDDDPRIVEIVLDRPLTLGQTTTFTFNDGTAVNVVEFTPLNPAACCRPDNTCTQTIEADCTAEGGTFAEGATCSLPRTCCSSTSECSLVDPICCGLSGGTPTAGSPCEGDTDDDGVDAACGDTCPNDPGNDKDGDGLCADADPCPNLNPNDADHDGRPDCVTPPPIPAISRWGVVVLFLLFLAGAKRRSRTRRGG